MPQLILGLAFAWGVPMAFAAQKQQLPLIAWLMFFSAFCWIVAFDTQYAMVDRDDDIKIGIKSTAVFFGRFERLWIAIFQVSMLLTLAAAGGLLHFGLVFYSLLAIATGLILYQQYLIFNLNRDRCLRAFKNNHWVGAIIFLAIALSEKMH